MRSNNHLSDRGIRVLLAPLGLALLAACSDGNDGFVANQASEVAAEPAETRYSAKITRTEYNVAHIEADDLGSLAFGQGYAVAEDAVCVIADQITKVRSERSKYLGPGAADENRTSDFAYKALQITERAERDFPSLSSDTQEAITGYVAGYNQYLRETDADNLPEACRGAEWVKEISPLDLFAYQIDLASLLTSQVLLDFIVAAAPPAQQVASQSTQVRRLEAGQAEASLPNLREVRFGSNGLVLGSEMTESGRGLMLSNTHLPWSGEITYNEFHLTIPGEFNAAGVVALGTPLISVGFNETSAQTVTVSLANKFTAYQLRLSEDSPTSYYYDDEIREMTSFDTAIEVLQEDGSLVTEERTFYRSHYGPMISVPFLGEWTNTSAMTARFPEDVSGIVDASMQVIRTEGIEELKELMRDVGWLLFVNVMRVTPDGEVFYADGSTVPNLSPEALAGYGQRVQNDFVTQLLAQNGIVLLDGSDSLFEWVEDERAATPGTIPFDDAPQYQGRDYAVHNNDNPWLVNEQNPITGFSPLYGAVETPRQPRNRMAFTMIGDEAGADGKFSVAELQGLQFSNRGLVGELIKDDLAAYCLLDPVFDLGGDVVDLAEACTLLANWDGLHNLDSIGAVIFREFMAAYSEAQITTGEGLYAVPFDVSDPVNTPNTLAIPGGDRADSELLRNLALAVRRLETVGISLDAPLSDWQFTDRTGERVAMHGGNGGLDGAWNLIGYLDGLFNSTLSDEMPPSFINPTTGLTAEGYATNFGPTYIMTVSYEENGPRAEGMLFYGQSRDPNSPHYSDQMSLYVDKEWRPIYFTAEEVEANAVSSMEVNGE